MKGRQVVLSLVGMKERALGRLKEYLEKRTLRERLYIVLVAFVLFAVADIWMIARSLSGVYRQPKIQHIESPLNP